MEEAEKEIAAREFLKTGKECGLSISDLALECDRIIQRVRHRSLKEALKLAQAFVKRSNKYRELRLTAYGALARVAHMSGNHREALKVFLKARDLAAKAPLLRARIDRALIDVYMYLNDFKKSRYYARRAMDGFITLKSESDLAQTRVNYGNLLHRQDRHRDAELLYRQAADFFETTDNKLAVARCYYNRANTLVQLFDFPEAEKLYRAALEINSAAGFELEATDARYGLAWLKMLEGKFHEALLELNACERAFREGGDPRGEALCNLDRAEVYLGLGLYYDALLSARAAVRYFARLRLGYEHSKASLFRGEAALALGHKAEARTAIATATKGFSKENNRGFLGVVHLMSADMPPRNGRRRVYEIRTARALFEKAQLPLWEAICDLKITSEAEYAPDAFNRLSHNPAARAVPHLFTAWQTAFGDYQYHHDHEDLAIHHWKLAADRLDKVRAQLPPLELRDAYTRRLNSPHLRLISTQLSHDPASAALWSERFKTAGLWAPISIEDSNPARRRIQKSLAQLAAEISALSGQISGRPGERSLAATSNGKTIYRLQRHFREELIALEKLPSAPAISLNRLYRDINEVSFLLPIVQFHIHGDEIIAFVHSTGNTTLHRLPIGRQSLAQLMQRWQFILESEILTKYLPDCNHSAAEAAIWRELGEGLWHPLDIPKSEEKVLIIPEGELANLPWSALVVEEHPLFERHHFILAPSIRHFLAARGRHIVSEKVEIFRGKADNIPQVERELRILMEKAGTQAILHAPCRRENWPSNGTARLWHFSGHALLRADNPFYSYLSLENGPLFAADFRLKNCEVQLAILAACRSGEEVAMPGEESSGLVRSLLEMGARNVIASHWPVSDETTALWMGAFYDKYFDHENILNAARHASAIVRDKYPSAYHWAAFSVLGAGDKGE